MASARGVNGSIQWLAANTRLDSSANVSLSASETTHPTYDSLVTADKTIRQAQHVSTIPLYIQPLPTDKLQFGAFTDAACVARPVGHRKGVSLSLLRTMPWQTER